MAVSKIDTFSLKGKVLEILDEKDALTIKIICKPEWLVLHIRNSLKVRLNDSIIVKGNFELGEIHKVNVELNDKNTQGNV